MFLYSIDRKPIIKDSKGVYIKDLTKSIFNLSSANYINTSVYMVPKGFQMRPDLISQSVYNNTIYAEFILKYNDISNPFTIAPHDIILVPVLEDFKDHVKVNDDGTNTTEERRLRNTFKYIDQTKVPKKTSSNSKFNTRKLEPVESTSQLPPNITKETDTGVTYRNGRVYFGEGIGQSACLKNGMSSSEFLTKVIKKKV